MPRSASRFPVLALIGLIASAVVGADSTPAADPPVLRAGAAAVDITPQEFPINMPGGFSPNPATAVHDPFHARALVLDDGQTTLAMVVVDTLGMGREPVDEAKAIASKATGIAMDKILVSSTHTHSGPPSNTKEGNAPAVAYRKRLIEGVARSIIDAHKQLRPAAVGAAAHPLPDEVFNRRWFMKPGKMPLNPYGLLDQVKMNPGTNPEVLDRPAGPTDPDVTILSVVEPKGNKPIAVYANYSLHYVGGAPQGLLSADYFGEFARVMPSRVKGGERFVGMLSNGTSGDINNIPFPMGQPPRPPREPYEQIRIVAQKTADAAWHARNKITEHQADARLGMVERLVTLKLRKPTPAQLEAAQDVLAIKDEAKIAELPRLAQEYARRAVSAAENPDSTIDVQVQAIRVGDLAICCIPFETFCEIGLELKGSSPFSTTMVVGLSNARHGYLPTPEQHRLGGYETWIGTNQVEENASVILVKQLREMLAELKAAK
jgi:neutral ceramidase